jgi:hypothetical protein
MFARSSAESRKPRSCLASLMAIHSDTSSETITAARPSPLSR